MSEKKEMITLLELYYRPPNGQLKLEDICREMAESYKNNSVATVGDINFSTMYWDSHSVMCLNAVEFVECIQESFLSQYIEDPSRERA